MGEVHMTCGCIAKGNEWLEAWWWGCPEDLSIGCLCEKHARAYGAVRAKDTDEALRKLKLMDIVRKWMEVLGICVDGIPYAFDDHQIDYYAPILVEELVRRMND